MATSMYGPQKVFDFWIGLLRRPMDWFEHLYINGKQVAAFFYHTDASVSATQSSAATRIESVWRGNAQRREGILKVTTDAAREPAAPRVGAQVRARMQVLEDTGARRLLRGLARTPEEAEVVERLFARAKSESEPAPAADPPQPGTEASPNQGPQPAAAVL